MSEFIEAAYVARDIAEHGSYVYPEEVIAALDALEARIAELEPRVVTTAEELDTLPVLSVIRTGDFETYEKQTDGEGHYFWVCVGDLEWYESGAVLEGGPATVLHEASK